RGSGRSRPEHHGRHPLPPLARQSVQGRHAAHAGRVQRRPRSRPQVRRRPSLRRDAPIRPSRRRLLPSAPGADAQEGRRRGGEVIDPRSRAERAIFDEDDSDLADNQEFDRALSAGNEALSQGNSADARVALEKALRYKPRNQRARNLLGLSLFKLGELSRAEEIYRSLIEDHPADPTLRVNLGLVFLKQNASADAVRCFETALDQASRANWVATNPGKPAAPPVMPEIARTSRGAVVANAPEPSNPAGVSAEVPEPSADSPPSMAQYTSAKRLPVPDPAGGFAIGPSEVSIQVRGEMLTRLDGLVASWGSLTMKPELKRFRGKATDKPFGEGSRRMLRASGEGRYVISREGRCFTALELADEPAYFREEVLFAFEESILFENGRVPSKGGTDLHLVHLRGRGKLLLATFGVPRAVDIQKGEPLRIPMDQLVGWHGPLIQPRLLAMVEEAPELGVALELAGEGRALLDVPPGR